MFCLARTDQCVLQEKLSFKMLRLNFCSRLDWGSNIIPIAKRASKKIGILIRSIKFLFLGVALYLYKSTMQPCMKYYDHVWAGISSCYLKFWDKIQKRICRTVGSSYVLDMTNWERYLYQISNCYWKLLSEVKELTLEVVVDLLDFKHVIIRNTDSTKLILRSVNLYTPYLTSS